MSDEDAALFVSDSSGVAPYRLRCSYCGSPEEPMNCSACGARETDMAVDVQNNLIEQFRNLKPGEIMPITDAELQEIRNADRPRPTVESIMAFIDALLARRLTDEETIAAMKAEIARLKSNPA